MDPSSTSGLDFGDASTPFRCLPMPIPGGHREFDNKNAHSHALTRGANTHALPEPAPTKAGNLPLARELHFILFGLKWPLFGKVVLKGSLLLLLPSPGTSSLAASPGIFLLLLCWELKTKTNPKFFDFSSDFPLEKQGEPTFAWEPTTERSTTELTRVVDGGNGAERRRDTEFSRPTDFGTAQILRGSFTVSRNADTILCGKF